MADTIDIETGALIKSFICEKNNSFSGDFRRLKNVLIQINVAISKHNIDFTCFSSFYVISYKNMSIFKLNEKNINDLIDEQLHQMFSFQTLIFYSCKCSIESSVVFSSKKEHRKSFAIFCIICSRA